MLARSPTIENELGLEACTYPTGNAEIDHHIISNYDKDMVLFLRASLPANFGDKQTLRIRKFRLHGSDENLNGLKQSRINAATAVTTYPNSYFTIDCGDSDLRRDHANTDLLSLNQELYAMQEKNRFICEENEQLCNDIQDLVVENRDLMASNERLMGIIYSQQQNIQELEQGLDESVRAVDEASTKQIDNEFQLKFKLHNILVEKEQLATALQRLQEDYEAMSETLKNMISNDTRSFDESDKGLLIDEASLHVSKVSEKHLKTRVPLLLSLKQIMPRQREPSGRNEKKRKPFQATDGQKKNLETHSDNGLWQKHGQLPNSISDGLLVGFGQTDDSYYTDHSEQSGMRIVCNSSTTINLQGSKMSEGLLVGFNEADSITV